MERLFKLGLVACGFFLATLASSTQLTAAQSSAAAGSCVGSGNCGTTSQGTELYGKWTEGSGGTSPIGFGH